MSCSMRHYSKLKVYGGFLGSRTCQVFSTASSVSLAAKMAPMVSRRTTLEPGSFTTQNIGQWYSIPVAHLEKLSYKTTLPRYYMKQVETLLECSMMIRRQFVDMMNCMRHMNPDAPVNRYVFYGAFGTGKSVALWQTVQWAHSNGWIVCFVPFARTWTRPRTELTQSSWRSERFDLPVHAVQWLTYFRKANEELIKQHQLLTTKDYTWTARESTPIGSSLIDLLELGVKRPKLASDCMGAVLRELKISAKEKKVKILVAINLVNSLFVQARHRRPDGSYMHASEISLIYNMTKLCLSDWNNGAVVTTVDLRELGHHQRPPYTPYYLLGQEGFETLDPFVPIELTNYTEHEANSCLDYYTEKNWIQRPNAKTEEGRREIIHLSARNPHLLERTIAAY